MQLNDCILTFIVNHYYDIFAVCLATLFLCLLVAFICRLPDYFSTIRAVKSEDNSTHEELQQTTSTSVSIVVPTLNTAEALAKNLPHFLSQKYSGKFEVIVADENSEDDTSDVIKRLQIDYANLRFTFVPASARNIERRKLALTLGIRAARSEWVIVVSPDCYPMSNSWLQNMAQHLTTERDFVTAYVNYDAEESAAARRAAFERLHAQMQRLRSWKHGSITGCEMSNYAMRKSWFLENSGFADSLCLNFGEESILACRHARAERTACLLSEQTRLYEEAPSAEHLQTLRIYAKETLRHLPRAAKNYSLLTHLFVWMSHLGFWSFAIFVTTWATLFTSWEEMSKITIAYTACMLILAIIGLAVAPMILHIATKRMGEDKFTFTFFTNTALFPLRNTILNIMRYGRRTEFVRKFL